MGDGSDRGRDRVASLRISSAGDRRTSRAARAEQDNTIEDKAREALTELDPFWKELFPAE